jgi:RNA polymerase sigma-70 factor (ECF subfamily)
MLISSQTLTSLFSFATNAVPADSPSPSPDVLDLIALAQRGDRSAIGRLYQEYVQRIFRYILFRVPTYVDAEDLTAEVFVNMVKGLPSYQVTGAPFEAWLYRIAGAQVANYYRQTSHRQQTELSETMPDTILSPEEVVLEKQMFSHLRNALGKLPEEYQTILILRFVERKSHEEVAAQLDKTVSAVKNAQYHALTRLTEILGADHKARHYLRGSHI